MGALKIRATGLGEDLETFLWLLNEMNRSSPELRKVNVKKYFNNGNEKSTVVHYELTFEPPE